MTNEELCVELAKHTLMTQPLNMNEFYALKEKPTLPDDLVRAACTVLTATEVSARAAMLKGWVETLPKDVVFSLNMQLALLDEFIAAMREIHAYKAKQAANAS